VTRCPKLTTFFCTGNGAGGTTPSAPSGRANAISVAVLLVASGLENSEEFDITLGSLRAQQHPDLQICAVCSGEGEALLRASYQKLGFTRELIVVPRSPHEWPLALRECHADLVGAIWIGDELRPWACSQIVECSLGCGGTVDLVYADHDCLDTTGYRDPVFKPAWSPIFLRRFNYIGDTWFIGRRALHAIAPVEWDRSALTGHSVLIQLTRSDAAVGHVPAVLFSAGRHNPGRAFSRKPARAGADVACEHLPRVSVIVPTRVADEAGLKTCLTGLLERTQYPALEIVVVPNNISTPDTGTWLHEWPLQVLPWSGVFNWSAINNFAAARATGDLLLFLNDDIAVTHPDWLLNMVLLQGETGAAAIGPLLTYRDGRTQHAGINFVYHGGGAQHLFRGCLGHDRNAEWLARFPREVSAITGACMLVSRGAFEAVGGFDESFAIASNDTDFCLRLGQAGLTVLVDPEAVLIHHEGISRAGLAEMDDVLRFWDKWEPFLRGGDPLWNPNLAFDRDNWVPEFDVVRSHASRIAGHSPLAPPHETDTNTGSNDS
jgi:O-antigen biosynthesis protein